MDSSRGAPSTYISGIDVIYGTLVPSLNEPQDIKNIRAYDPSGNLLTFNESDINWMSGGEHVWLFPKTTKIYSESIKSITFIHQPGRPLEGPTTTPDIARGDGGHYRQLTIDTAAAAVEGGTNNRPGVVRLGLLRSPTAIEGIPEKLRDKFLGKTGDINEGRGRDWLYLMWGTW